MGIFDNKDYLPTGNRNAAGGQYYKYILNELNPTIDEFIEYHKMYCAVSGSPIKPNKNNRDFIVLKDMNNKNICGYYYRCCTPCNCDLMRENNTLRAKKLLKKNLYGSEDPCKTKKYPLILALYKNNETENGIVENGRLKIGILHDVKYVLI